MTDKTPKKMAENLVNTHAASAKTTDTARDSVPKSKALPQADALKARFKAGSIPLQTDFADLIDLANIGRQAVGDEGTGFGLVKDDKNRLRYDPRKIANFTYDLSPSTNNERILLSDAFAADVKEHSRIALLALSDVIGPDIATATLAGNSTTYTVKAVKIDANGKKVYTSVKIIAHKAIGQSSSFVPFEYVQNVNASYSLWYVFELDTTSDDFSNCTLVIDPLTLVVKHITDYSSSPLDGEIISLLTFHFVYNGVIVGDGLQVDNMKIAAKVDEGKGLQVNTSGISVKAGNGIAVNSSGINVKLAKGDYTNGGEGHGTNGATSGSGGGLSLTANGLSVDAGDGMQINTRGVSIKLTANSGLSADETNGVRVKAAKGISVDQDGVAVKLGLGLRYGGEGLDVLCKPSGGLQASKDGTWVISGQGITVDSAGVGVKAGNGLAVTSSGVNIKLAKGSHTNGGAGQGTDGTTNGNAGGLALSSAGLSVDAGNGIQIDSQGVSIKLAQNSGLSADENNGMALNQYAWIRTMCGLHGADFYAYESGCAVFFCNIHEGCVAYVYGREGKYISTQKNALTLNGYGAGQIMAITEPGSNSQATNMIAWYTTKASTGYYFTCKVKSFLDDNSNYSVSIKLISAP
ncbi:hypothetical protein ACGGX0_003514 [Salmonella enterica]|nr:hypothetical protein [Salmonella enterica]EKS4548336.1 hypothetical protein [Salmonella enterica]EKS4590808.1 hypothetical protein [Salmonella enterica]EKS4835230.1 hypothetical protein [Salmonella enterica]EKS4853596.1 hypothetical protein [Salmonella enterica]